MEKLNETIQNLDVIQEQIRTWFSNMFKLLQFEHCGTRYFEAESKIKDAYQLLLTYRQNPSDSHKQDFLQSCRGEGTCHWHLNELLLALSGRSGTFGCDLMD